MDQPPTYRIPDPRIEEQCAACGAPLDADTSFCSACGSAQRISGRAPSFEAPLPSPPRRRRPRWLLPALTVGGLTAVIGGVALALALLGQEAPHLANASAAPVVSPSASVSEPALPSVSASPASSAPSARADAPIIPNRGIARVVTGDDLNLREAGSRDAEILAVLKQGQRLFVIGEPTDDGDLRWYRVATVEDAACGVACGTIGFVATPRASEDRWIVQTELSCPSSPMSADVFLALSPLEALSCYGRDDIVVTGTVEGPIYGWSTPLRVTPRWMAGDHGVFLRDAWWVTYRAHPDAGLSIPTGGQIVRIVGHFEDPAATECQGTVDPAFFGGQIPADFVPPSTARIVLDCRASFVWTAYEVLGSEALPEMPAALANETPPDAHVLELGADVTVDTRGMAPDAEAPCVTDSFSVGLGRTTWWRFSGTGGDTTIDTTGSNFDTVVGLYVDDEAGVLTQVACVDDVAAGLQAVLHMPTELARDYWIQVGGFGGAAGALTLELGGP